MKRNAADLWVRLAALAVTGCLCGKAHAETTSFQPFHWHVGSLGGLPPAPLALLVPVRLGERDCDMQLDTGVNASVIWHAPLANDGPQRPLKLSLGELAAHVEVGPAAQRAIDECTSGHAVGTLGNAFFERGTLTLDIARQRLAWQAGSALNKHPRARPFFYAAPATDGWVYEGGHIFIELDTQQAGKGYGMLDTGAASAEIAVLDAAWWTRLTGSADMQGPHITSFTVSSWGRSLACASAPTVVAVGIGIDNVSPVALRATYCPELAFRPTIRVIGLVGLAPFMRSIVTIDYPGRRWLLETAAPSP
jgi:hypothetical protein